MHMAGRRIHERLKKVMRLDRWTIRAVFLAIGVSVLCLGGWGLRAEAGENKASAAEQTRAEACPPAASVPDPDTGFSLPRSPREVGPLDLVPLLPGGGAPSLCLAKPAGSRMNLGGRGKIDNICVVPFAPAPGPAVGAFVCELLFGNLMRAYLSVEARLECQQRRITCQRNGCPGPCYLDVAASRDQGFSYAPRDADCAADPKQAKLGRTASCSYGNIQFECVCSCPSARPTPLPPKPIVEP